MPDRRKWINSLRENANKDGNNRTLDLALANLLEVHEEQGEYHLGDHICALLKACFIAAGQSSNNADKAFLFCSLTLADIRLQFDALAKK